MNTLLIGVVLLVNLNSAFGRAGEGAGNGGGRGREFPRISFGDLTIRVLVPKRTFGNSIL